jgi:hypothetical protein
MKTKTELLMNFSSQSLTDELERRKEFEVNDEYIDCHCRQHGHEFSEDSGIIHLMRGDPEFWELLMTSPSPRNYRIEGTRQYSPSGAIDGRLYPIYQDVLPKVNAARIAHGWEPIR